MIAPGPAGPKKIRELEDAWTAVDQGEDHHGRAQAESRSPAAQAERAVHRLEVGLRAITQSILAGLLERDAQGARHGRHGLPRIGAGGETAVAREDQPGAGDGLVSEPGARHE